MGFAKLPKAQTEFKWLDLHGRIFKVAVVMPAPDLNEPIGQVYLMDEKANVYLIHEWVAGSGGENKTEAMFYKAT